MLLDIAVTGFVLGISSHQRERVGPEEVVVRVPGHVVFLERPILSFSREIIEFLRDLSFYGSEFTQEFLFGLAFRGELCAGVVQAELAVDRLHLLWLSGFALKVIGLI